MTLCKSLCRVLVKMKKALHSKAFRSSIVARTGFEPIHTEPKSVVLPLDDRAIESANIYLFSKKKTLLDNFQSKKVEAFTFYRLLKVS
jgi:hypothetical protein